MLRCAFYRRQKQILQIMGYVHHPQKCTFLHIAQQIRGQSWSYFSIINPYVVAIQIYNINFIGVEFMEIGADEVDVRGWLKTFVRHCKCNIDNILTSYRTKKSLSNNTISYLIDGHVTP